MKILTFKNNSGKVVEYLTDLIDGNDSFTIFQITERVLGIPQTGLTDDSICKGFFVHLKEHDLAEFKAFAMDNAYTLTAIENTAGTSTETVIWGGSYGDGGAIGEEQL